MDEHDGMLLLKALHLIELHTGLKSLSKTWMTGFFFAENIKLGLYNNGTVFFFQSFGMFQTKRCVWSICKKKKLVKKWYVNATMVAVSFIWANFLKLGKQRVIAVSFIVLYFQKGDVSTIFTLCYLHWQRLENTQSPKRCDTNKNQEDCICPSNVNSVHSVNRVQSGL